jgi:hypothetical protein
MLTVSSAPGVVLVGLNISTVSLAPGAVLVGSLNTPGTLLEGPARSSVFSRLDTYLLVRGSRSRRAGGINWRGRSVVNSPIRKGMLGCTGLAIVRNRGLARG